MPRQKGYKGRPAAVTHVVKDRNGRIVDCGTKGYCNEAAIASNFDYQTDEYTVEPFDASKFMGQEY